MKKSLVIAAAAGSLALSSLAVADTPTSKDGFNAPTLAPLSMQPAVQPSYFTGRLGLLLPFDSNLRDASSLFFGAGIDYTFSNQWFTNGESFISLDWLGRTNGGGRFNLFPFCINERFFLSPKTATGNQTYAFIGLGAFLFDFNSSTFRFGGRAGLGVNITSNVIAEATLYLSTADNGIRGDMIGAYIGYKFGG